MRKLILLSLLFISTLLIGQAPIFDWNGNLGSHRDAVSNSLGTAQTNMEFAKDQKGLSLYSYTATVTSGIIYTGTPDFTDLTVECWFKTNEYTDYSNFFCFTNTPGNRFQIYKASTSDDFRFFANGFYSNYASSGLNDNQWHHLICVWNGATRRLYIDNIEVSMSGDIAVGTQTANQAWLGDTPTSHGMNCNIAKLRAWDRVLSTQEMNASYTAFLNPPSLNQEYTIISQPQNKDLSYIPNLVASYTFANPIKGELIDEAGTNNGTVVGGISTREGMRFDGVDDYVDLGTIAVDDDLQLNSAFTICYRGTNLLTGDSFQRIVDKSSSSSGGNGYILAINSGKIDFSINGTIYRGDDVNIDTQTHDIIAVNDGVSSYIIYVDGLPINATLVSGIWENPPNVSTNMKIGDWNSAGRRAFNGVIAELQIYNKAFTQQDVDAYHAKWEKVVKLIDFEFAPVGLPAMGWQQGTGSYEVSESVTGLDHRKYLECTASGTTSFYVNDLTDSTYVESLHYYNSGWTDVGGYTIYRVAADNAWFSYSGDKVTFTLTNGQAIDNIIIKNQK